MARVLLLRPEAQALDSAVVLRALGHEPLLLPLQAIRPTGAAMPAGRWGAFVVTSPNAVAPLAAAFPGDGRPMLSVGAATAARLREAGFGNVTAGAGTGASLAGPAAELGQAAGPLLLAVGRVRDGALEAALAAAGAEFGLWEVYDTVPRRPEAAEVEAVLGGRAPDAVCLLSAGQAAAYAALAAAHPAFFAPPPRLLCLSERVAARLPAELRASASISATPDLPALFAGAGRPS